MPEALLWAPQAWIEGGWKNAVLLRADAGGRWAEITPGVAQAPPGAQVLAGPVLPGLVNGHSHAFQRAFAGLAERRLPVQHGARDDFWSWRDRMYGVALRVTPAQLRAIAAQLDLELLCGGYTQVCEFHYLHHDAAGKPYDDPFALSWALCDAAADTGIGLTLLPVLYERAGFTEAGLRPDQRRFSSTPAFVRSLCQAVAAAHRPLLDAGVAIHSLRAAAPASIAALLRGLEVDGHTGPVHIHVAEQAREVSDCQAATGARPIEWLCRELQPDARWQLVHATHATAAEIAAVAEAGAGVVFCPSTEANLGDGLADLPRWLAAGVPLCVGSDSQVTRSWGQELRWLEYGQRLLRQERNVAAGGAAAGPGSLATAARLFAAASTGGGRAAGQARWGLVIGARADALVLDLEATGLRGVPPSYLLDALVFASDTPALRDVFVAGACVINAGHHARAAAISAGFVAAMAALWHDPAP